VGQIGVSGAEPALLYCREWMEISKGPRTPELLLYSNEEQWLYTLRDP